MENGVISRDRYLSQKDYGMWLQIQQNTFTNWVNECLRGRALVLDDLRTDLSDGVNLVALVETLSRQRIHGSVSHPSNHYQKLQNITIALDTIRKDGVKIVNIDSSDIFENNLKLILALVWQLILKYQVGLSGSQNKSWILKWLQGVIPECSVTNLTTDLNNGIALHALIDFCKPGLSPDWRHLDRDNRVENCRSAMKLARQHFNIPLILRPEDLASPELDERSSITYLSYFITLGGPGYSASLDQVAARTKPMALSNFTTDWQSGQALVNLVRSAGGRVGEGQGSVLETLRQGIESGKQLGVEPLLAPEEILSETSEHLGLMAYSVQFLRFPSYIYYTDLSPELNDEHRSVSDTFINLMSNSTTVSHENNTTIVKHQHHSEYRDDQSTHASTIHSPGIANNGGQFATFDLVTKNNGPGPRVEAPPPDQLKVDVYSTGVIMESKIRGGFDPEKFLLESVSPNGRIIKITGDGNYAADFGASEIGRWNVAMSYDNKVMEKCPVDVCDPSQVLVRDLKGGLAGKSNQFQVDCTQAGPGDVGVDVTSQGRLIPSSVNKTGTSGLYNVRFTPYNPGPHEINVHFNRAEIRDADFYTFDKEERQRKAVFYTEITPQQGFVEIKATCDWEIDYITGGPFVCHVTDSMDIPVYRMQDGTVCGRPELIVDGSRVGPGRVDAEVTHNGLRYPCKIREEKERPNVYRVRFRPRGPGVYRVWISLDGTPIKGSPFIQEIAELEAPSAYGDGLYRGVLGRPATFTINPRGYPGQVSVTIDGPSKPEQSKLEIQNDQTILATYYPTERGLHKVNVTMEGKHVKGSPFHPLIVDPFKVQVSGGWRPLLDETGIIPLKVRKEKILPFDVQEALPGELTAEVQGPNGKIPVTIDARKDGIHSVIFTPREPGKHYIHVNWGGFPLAHSPYTGEAILDPNDDEDSYPNVRLVPLHLRSPTASVPSSVVGPPYRIVDETDAPIRKPAGYTVYTDKRVEPTKIQQIISPEPRSNGPYPPIKLYQYENRGYTSPRPLSPQNSLARSNASSIRGPQKVVLSGKGLKEAVVRSPAYFQVDGTKADPGQPSAYLESVRYTIPVNYAPLRPNVYKCQYVPVKAGAYLLYIDWNGKALRGSPFKVNIRDPVDPNLVVTTFNLKGGVVGKDFEMKADPREAGIGHLTASCMDPVGREVPVRVSENYDGTISLKVKPVMAGVHRVEVRYNGQHVKGSPFAITIKESAPKGAVKVWGPGIENGVIPRFHSTFWVETTGAGAGDLRVRIIGPKGAFHVKMRKASEKDKIYQCFYDPVEPGVYTVHVQWSNVHVDGSPYTVLLGESELDLFRMQEEAGTVNPGELRNRSSNSSIIDGYNNNNNNSNSNYNTYNSVKRNSSLRPVNGGSSSAMMFNNNNNNNGGGGGYNDMMIAADGDRGRSGRGGGSVRRDNSLSPKGSGGGNYTSNSNDGVGDMLY